MLENKQIEELNSIIKGMINDDDLSKNDKKELLNHWLFKIETIPVKFPLTSSQLKGVVSIKENIKSAINDL